MTRWGFSLFAVLALCRTPALADDWSFGPFSIQWANGFTRLPEGSGMQYTNAEGVTVIVDNFVHKPMTADEEAGAVQNWVHFAQTSLPGLAAGQGRITRPLTSEDLPQGGTLYSVAADGLDPSAPQFGLFFLDISKKGDIAQFTVEGTGLQKDHWDAFWKLFQTAKWTD